ncbi:MAG: Rrf2 family transcriptional regulator [Alphaproteobacteria bacterium]
MRLSTKGRYAVMAMADLARRQGASSDERAVSLAEIAIRQQISLSYLEQLFARLRRQGLVRSLRGPGGGYLLARTADATSIAEIVMAVDEPLRATRCSGKSKGCMLKGERCLTHDLWEEMGRKIEGYLASVSLADVARGRLAPEAPVS